MSITLISGPIGLTLGVPVLSPFSSKRLPRERIDTPTLSYTAYGTPKREGGWFEPKHIWEFEVNLRESTDVLKLEQIYARQLLVKPTPQIVLLDQTRLFSEPSPRTRAKIPDTVEIAAHGVVSYFAQFLAEFAEEPKFSQDGKYTIAAIRLQETARLPA